MLPFGAEAIAVLKEHFCSPCFPTYKARGHLLPLYLSSTTFLYPKMFFQQKQDSLTIDGYLTNTCFYKKVVRGKYYSTQGRQKHLKCGGTCIQGTPLHAKRDDYVV